MEDTKFGDVTLNFVDLLVDKKRNELIKDMIKEFDSIYNKLTNTQVANVISGVKIQSLCGAKNVRIKNVVDPSLNAGFIVQYGKDGSCYIDMIVKE